MQKKWDRWELNQQYTTRINHSLSFDFESELVEKQELILET